MMGITDDRPVHIVIISGLAPDALRTGLADGYLTSLGFLTSAGTLRYDCVAPFPSVTPTGVATAATGLSPGHHGILGRAWYERRHAHVHEFDPARDLAAPDSPVLDQRLHEAGRRLATVNIPTGCGGTGLGVGADDRRVAELTADVVRRRAADVTVSLLRDTDVSAHEVGPDFASPALWRADRALARMLEAYGSREEAALRARWIVAGDHGMSRMHRDRPDHVQVHAMAPRALTQGRDGVLVVPNGRAAFVYLDDLATYEEIERVTEAFSLKPGVDQVFWQAHGWTCARHGDLRFEWRPGEGLRDARGQAWRVSGSGAVVGLEIASGVLVESQHVDPLRRILDFFAAPDAPDLVLTAQEGYEFSAGRPEYGSHGSLTAHDSLVPIVAVGTPTLPPHLRLQDVAEIALAALGLPNGLPASHAAAG